VLVPGQTVGVETSTGVTGARLSVHLVEKPRRTVRESCPTPWAWFHPDDRTGDDGTTVAYHADRSGNGRHLTPHGTSGVKVRTVGGQRLLYKDGPLGSTAELSVAFDGSGPVDWAGTPAESDPVTAWTVWCQVVDPDPSDVWFGLVPMSGEGTQLQAGTAFGGEAFTFEKTVGNLFGPALSGTHVLMFRFDTATGQAELWVDGTLVDSADDVDGPGSAGVMWGLQVGGAISSSGGLGELILWDRWVDDPCLPDGGA
jgi:hypothetical protein